MLQDVVVVCRDEGASAAVSIGFMGSRGAETTGIQDFAGPFNTTTIGAGAGEYGALEVFSDPSNPNVVGGGVTLGAGMRGGVTQGVSNTTVIDRTNLTTPQSQTTPAGSSNSSGANDGAKPSGGSSSSSSSGTSIGGGFQGVFEVGGRLDSDKLAKQTK